MKDRSDDPSQHERTLLPRSYILLLWVAFNGIRGSVTLTYAMVTRRRGSRGRNHGGGGGETKQVLRERARRHIFPLVETIPELPSEPPSQRWQKLGKEMGEINMGLVNEKKTSAALVLTHFHEDLYQQVYIDRSVSTCEDYMDRCMANLAAWWIRPPTMQVAAPSNFPQLHAIKSIKYNETSFYCVHAR